MTSPKFSTWRPNQGHDLGSLFSSLLRLAMTFFHSTLGAASLNDEEAYKCKKNGNRRGLRVLLEVKRLKTGVLQLKDPPDKAQNI